VPCTLDNVSTILCYHTSNIILINATLLLIYFFMMSKFMHWFYVYAYVLYELYFHYIAGIDVE